MASTEQIEDLRQKMLQERDALLTAVRSIDDGVAEIRPPDRDGEDGWSVKEQLVHLAQMDARYRSWCERALAEDNPDLDTPPTPLSDPPRYDFDAAHGTSLQDLVAEMDRQRTLTREFIDALAPDDYERRARSRLFGELTVLQWMRSYYRHDRMHVAQIEGRASEYQPRFLNGEPDQRRRR